MSRRARECAIATCGLPVHGLGLCNTHYRRRQRGRTVEGPLKITREPEDRFTEHMKRLANGCWEWLGTHTHDGYGMFRIGSRTDGTHKMVLAHRWSYEHFRGPIPKGRELDHIVCDNRGCANPEHVAVSTHKANSLRSSAPQALNARKTHCPRGHPYEAANTYVWPGAKGSSRQCRACKRD